MGESGERGRGQPENATLIEWLKAHSGNCAKYGAQCSDHPPIREMLRNEISNAQLDHGLLNPRTAKPYTRQWVWDRCNSLGIETRGKLGPRRIRTADFIAQQTRDRVAAWYRQMMSTEEGRVILRERQREKDRRRAQHDRLRAEDGILIGLDTSQPASSENVARAIGSGPTQPQNS